MFGNTESVEDANIFKHFASGQSKVYMHLSLTATCAICCRVCIIHGSKVYNCMLVNLHKNQDFWYSGNWAYVEYPRAFLCSYFLFCLQSSKA